MNRTRKLSVFFLLVLGLSCLATAQADRLDDILDRGSIRIGVSLFTPWTMQSASGELSGHEIDVARKLAADMGVKPEFTVYPWADIVGALNEGKIDLILAGMAITPQRALQVNFTRPYVESGVSLATNSHMTRDISDMRELNQPKIVVVTVAKTLGSDVAKLLFDDSDLRVMPSSSEAREAVLAGKAHAYVAGTIETTFLALEHPDAVDLPISKPLLTSVAGMGVRKGEQELLNFLNAWIASRSADGWLPATSKYWLKSLKWREALPE